MVNEAAKVQLLVAKAAQKVLWPWQRAHGGHGRTCCRP